MTYKEAWCKIVSEISNTYDDEVKEALFMLAEAASKQQEFADIQKQALDQMME